MGCSRNRQANGGLAEPEMTHHSDAIGIDLRVGLEVVHGTAETPDPCTDGGPAVVARRIEQRTDTIAATAGVIALDVGVAERCDGGDGYGEVAHDARDVSWLVHFGTC